MLHRFRFCTLLIAFVFLSSHQATTEDHVKPEPPKLSGWQRVFRKQAAEYRIVVDGDEKSAVKVMPEPVLHWSQPVRGGADGAVFLWTDSGRPIAIGTFFIWPMGNDLQGIAHELHSLTASPLTATWQQRKWTPPKDAIVWKPLPGAPAPAKSAEQRLRQMRDLARQFQAESHDKNDKKWELRLLPRPIYRYQIDDAKQPPTERHQILDGALFGFVEGTDLEVILLLEAHQSEQGPHWNYGFARMSDFVLKASYANKTVWEVAGGGYDNPLSAYHCVTVESRKSADEE